MYWSWEERDVHKQKISYRVKDVGGKVYAEGWIPATRFDLDRWMKTLPQPWSAAMEATMFSGWIYDHLKPHAAALKVAHPLMRQACFPEGRKQIIPLLLRQDGTLVD
jgi:transposase